MMLGSGEVSLVNGQATVVVKRIPAEAVVVLSRRKLLGTIGELAWTVTAGIGFTVTSLNVLDQSTVRWVVMT